MKNPYFICTIFLLLFFSCSQKQQEIEKPLEISKKAIFIIIDGIPADVIEKVQTPNLDAISEKGGYTRLYVGGEKGTYNETPTISAPGYINLLTSTWANKHNVWDNYNQEPNYHYWNIFRILETAKPEAKTAIFSTWTDNRTILVGEGQPEAGSFSIDYPFDGFEKDTIRFPHDKLANYISQIDSLVVNETADYILKNGPDLSWVYLEYTDDVGHGLGDSEYFYQSIRNADKQIGKIWQSIEQRMKEQNEEWMIAITTDHGRDSISGKDHGYQSERERTTWLVTNRPEVNARFTSSTMSVVDIAPSILHFMDVDIPKKVRYEMDGTSFLGAVSADSLRATMVDGNLNLFWNAIDTAASAQVWISFTNNYKNGSIDSYELLTNVNLNKKHLNYVLNERQQKKFKESQFLKITFETPNNILNRWVIQP